jgi:hypothetical protein
VAHETAPTGSSAFVSSYQTSIGRFATDPRTEGGGSEAARIKFAIENTTDQ